MRARPPIEMYTRRGAPARDDAMGRCRRRQDGGCRKPRSLADPGGPPGSAQDPGQRLFHILGQARSPVSGPGLRATSPPGTSTAAIGTAALIRAAISTAAATWPEAVRRTGRRLPDMAAVPALDLAKPPHQVHAVADRAPVEVGCPVE
jgi:hypothetical protein